MRRAGVEQISVALLGNADDAFKALREKFEGILSLENIATTSIESAQADFHFRGQCHTPDGCEVSVRTVNGKVVRAAVGYVQAVARS